MKIRQIYLDNAATTPVDPKVLGAMMPYLTDRYGNPSSLHQLGRESKLAIENARGDIAKILNSRPDEIVFTGSSTEADNLAILGAAYGYKNKGRHIIVSKIEHKAILEAARKLERDGFEVTYLNVDADGLVNISELKRSIKQDTILISITTANNEIGTIQPITEISKIVQGAKNGHLPLFHTDAAQVAGSLPLSADELGIDLMTLNGSKIYGPKGIGCLYVKNGIDLEPIIVGGEQEKRLRAGTENVSLIVGFAEALKLAEELRPQENERLTDLRDYFIKNIMKAVSDCRLNGHPTKRLPNNINVSIKGVEGESVVLMLDRYGVFASTGSACGATDLQPSHVISAIGVSPELSHSNIRFTIGRKTMKEDIDYVLEILPPIIAKLRMISALK